MDPSWELRSHPIASPKNKQPKTHLRISKAWHLPGPPGKNFRWIPWSDKTAICNCLEDHLLPIASMVIGHGIFTYMEKLIFMVNVGKYTINACYGILKQNDWRCLSSWFVLHRLWYITSWNKKTDVSILFHAFQAKLILWLFVAVLWKDGSIL